MRGTAVRLTLAMSLLAFGACGGQVTRDNAGATTGAIVGAGLAPSAGEVSGEVVTECALGS
jgi:hypothetical protein